MRYSKTHEWISDDGKVGITTHAQKELGEIVHVEMPEVGQEINAFEECVVLESTKAAADIYSPAKGKVVKVNQEVIDNPALLNHDPENAGWLFQLEVECPPENLLDKAAYDTLLKS